MVLVLCKPSGKRQRSATDTNQLLSDIWNQQQSELQKYGHCKSLFPTSEGTYFCPHLGRLTSLFTCHNFNYLSLNSLLLLCHMYFPFSSNIFSPYPTTNFLQNISIWVNEARKLPHIFFSLWSQTWIFSRTSYPISPYSIIIIIIIILVPTTPISSSQCLSTWRGGETNQTHQNSSHSIILPLQSCEKSLTFSSYYPAILASTQC